MKEKRETWKRIIIVASALVIFMALVAGTGYFCYQKGAEHGDAAARDEVEASVMALGEAMAEKNELGEKLEKFAAETPAEFNGENIQAYIDKRGEMCESLKDADAKAKLGELKEKAEEFKATYAGENNEEIATKLGELKETAGKISTEITEIYNWRIRASIEEMEVF